MESLRTRLLRLGYAAGATVAGLLLALFEQLHFNVPLFLLAASSAIASLPAIVAFSILSWPVALASAFFLLVAVIIVFALPFRITRAERVVWLVYAIALGPLLHGSLNAYYASQPAPPGKRVCYNDSSPASNGQICLYEQTFTSLPVPYVAATHGARPRAPSPAVTIDMHATPFPLLSHPTPLP